MSPTLWKELAKLIRGDAKLLKGFLGQASNLASITDHRTQEIAFESVYRMWKVTWLTRLRFRLNTDVSAQEDGERRVNLRRSLTALSRILRVFVWIFVTVVNYCVRSWKVWKRNGGFQSGISLFLRQN